MNILVVIFVVTNLGMHRMLPYKELFKCLEFIIKSPKFNFSHLTSDKMALNLIDSDHFQQCMPLPGRDRMGRRVSQSTRLLTNCLAMLTSPLHSPLLHFIDSLR
jgi:hypothetical protein